MVGHSSRHFNCGCVFFLGQEIFLVHGLSRDSLCIIVCDVLTAYCWCSKCDCVVCCRLCAFTSTAASDVPGETSAGELMNERTRRLIKIFRESRLRQTVNVSLYHVTKFPLYLSFTIH